MKKKLVVLMSLLLVATNTLYVSAAPVSVGDPEVVIVEDGDVEIEPESENPDFDEEISEKNPEKYRKKPPKIWLKLHRKITPKSIPK